jgi:hypothetical protein
VNTKLAFLDEMDEEDDPKAEVNTIVFLQPKGPSGNHQCRRSDDYPRKRL